MTASGLVRILAQRGFERVRQSGWGRDDRAAAYGRLCTCQNSACPKSEAVTQLREKTR
jgi:hypothetical protein